MPTGDELRATELLGQLGRTGWHSHWPAVIWEDDARFSFITINWRGKPLRTFKIVVRLIKAFRLV
jgi:hypothetical protein